MIDLENFKLIPKECDLDIMIQKNATLTLQNQKLNNFVIRLIGMAFVATVVVVIIYLKSREEKEKIKVVI